MGHLGGDKPFFGLTGGWLTTWITVRVLNVFLINSTQFILM